MNSVIAAQRLHNQYITRVGRHGPADLVAWLGAVQAQEYPFARWGLGLRMPERTTDEAIERAFDEGRLLRTHVMRPTWHFVTPLDIRWMLELTAPHVHRTMGYYNRQLELDTRTLTRGAAVLERALSNRQYLTRGELGARLARAGMDMKGQRLARVAMHAELEGIICSGPRRGKQFTYALIAERAPQARRMPRDEALAELTRRYFRSHGPATVRDFVWWSGLKSADAKRGLEINRARQEAIGGRTYWTVGPDRRGTPQAGGVHLLPVYDEYLVAYRDREAVPHPAAVIESGAREHVIFQHALIINGQIAGTWRSVRASDGAGVAVFPLRPLTRTERRAISDTAARYERFLGAAVSVSIS